MKVKNYTNFNDLHTEPESHVSFLKIPVTPSDQSVE